MNNLDKTVSFEYNDLCLRIILYPINVQFDASPIFNKRIFIDLLEDFELVNTS